MTHGRVWGAFGTRLPRQGSCSGRHASSRSAVAASNRRLVGTCSNSRSCSRRSGIPPCGLWPRAWRWLVGCACPGTRAPSPLSPVPASSLCPSTRYGLRLPIWERVCVCPRGSSAPWPSSHGAVCAPSDSPRASAAYPPTRSRARSNGCWSIWVAERPATRWSVSAARSIDSRVTARAPMPSRSRAATASSSGSGRTKTARPSSYDVEVTDYDKS